MSKYLKDTMGALIFIVFGIFLIAVIPAAIPSTQLTSVGAKFFPQLISSGLIVCGACLLVISILKAKKEKVSFKKELCNLKVSFKLDRSSVNVAFTYIFTVIYALIYNKIGFIASSLMLVTALLMLYKARKPLYYIILYIMVFFVYLIFTMVLSVYLP